ncbi:hypothetical protein IHZ75_004384 [Salmonella enterica]|nr:hypothetical protein [Salmonella enterica]
MENGNLFNTNFGYVWEAISDLSHRVNELEAERESTIDAFEDGFAAGEKKAAVAKAPLKSVIEVSAPEVETLFKGAMSAATKAAYEARYLPRLEQLLQAVKAYRYHLTGEIK